jgi:predicted porin
MNKKLIALAVAGAFAPAMALAQGTNVTIYGTLNAAWNIIESKGATTAAQLSALGVTGLSAGANQPSRSRVDPDSSNIGFRVREDLGGGLAAWGQCESSANVDNGTGTLCSRNTGVGIEGPFGNIFLGQWDSPYKQQGALDVMGNTHIIAWVAIMSSPGINVASTTGGNGGTPFTATLSSTGGTTVTTGFTVTGTQASFDRRQTDTINYYTPNWAGFQAKFQYSANETKTDTILNTSGVPTSFGLDPKMYSLSLSYENGPFFVTGAYEQHDDFQADLLNVTTSLGTNGRFTKGDDDAWRLGAGFKFGNFRVTALYEELSYETTATNLTTLAAATGTVERDAWYLGASYTAAPHYFALSYADADDWDCGGTVALSAGVIARCANTAGKSYAAKYAYSLSKRTELFAHYIKIKNDANAQYTFGVNTLSGVAAGADPEGFGVGVKHTF